MDKLIDKFIEQCPMISQAPLPFIFCVLVLSILIGFLLYMLFRFTYKARFESKDDLLRLKDELIASRDYKFNTLQEQFNLLKNKVAELEEKVISKNLEIESLEKDIERLKDELGMSEAKVSQLEREKNENGKFTKSDPNLWTLAFGIPWHGKESPYCIKCNLPLHQSLKATNILECPNCKTEYPLMIGTNRYALDKAIDAIKKGEIGSPFLVLGT